MKGRASYTALLLAVLLVFLLNTACQGFCTAGVDAHGGQSDGFCHMDGDCKHHHRADNSTDGCELRCGCKGGGKDTGPTIKPFVPKGSTPIYPPQGGMSPPEYRASNYCHSIAPAHGPPRA